jgi:transcriptional regulator with PAS, ATPase and Fis domain
MVSTPSYQPTITMADAVQGFVGKSTAYQEVLNSALLAAQHPNTNVMIVGESGTGKEVIARIIHNNSVRRNYNFVSVNVAALSASLIESELFGHTRGAFTGANVQTKGFFLQADKGSIFLDEITEMPYELQSKLLRVIETRKVVSVGSSIETSYDSRIICATNQSLREQMFQNKFRLDLYHRLNTIEIVIPPLRDRQEDIEPILQHYIDKYALELKKPKPFIDKSILNLMQQYAFPGNVRELKNIVERMFILGNSLQWNAALLCKINPFIENPKAIDQIQIDEEELILKALIKAKGKQKDAALALGISEATIHRRITKYNLQQYTRKGN